MLPAAHSPDAALFAALVSRRPRPAEAPDGMAELILRLADSIRQGSALLREATAELGAGRGAARLTELLAQAEAAAREQAACARRLLASVPTPEETRAA